MPSREKPDTQAEKFAKAAKEVECDESEEAFNAALKRIAKAPVRKPIKETNKRTDQ